MLSAAASHIWKLSPSPFPHHICSIDSHYCHFLREIFHNQTNQRLTPNDQILHTTVHSEIREKKFPYDYKLKSRVVKLDMEVRYGNFFETKSRIKKLPIDMAH